MAGATPPPKNFWKKVNDYGLSKNVTFQENPDDSQLLSLYQGALCFALSSDEEGFGMVILEAMACGIPVVSTRCGGPDGIFTDGKHGYLVDVGNAFELAERLNFLCTNLRDNREMGLRAREHVENNFSEKVTRQTFFDTWNKLLGKRIHE